MPMLKNRVADVYLKLGKILNEPQSFGLDERAPEALIKALTEVREMLKSEMKEEVHSIESLEDELSQDADTPLVKQRKVMRAS